MERPNKQTLLEEVLSDWIEDGPKTEAVTAAGRIAEVLDDRHPSLLGRVRVTGGGRPRWLPCLQGVVARVGDRVLVSRIEGSAEPVVTGVLDGHAERPRPTLQGPALELRDDEALTVVGHRGRPLLQIRQGDRGPIVRLLQSDVGIEVDGVLSLEASAIRMRATRGDFDIEARDDVIVRGELIHLN